MKKLILFLLLALLGATAQAQTAVIKYESPKDFRLHLKDADEAAGMASSNRFDLTGDGVPELVLLREDTQDRPEAFVVVDLTTREVVWEIAYGDVVGLLGEEPIYYPGFFSFFEPGRKAAVFQGETTLGIIAVLLGLKQGAAASLTLPAEQALLFDVDADGQVEAIIRNRETRTVQVWGAGATGTATEEDIEHALHGLFQNYPNPFRETTTIAYEVEHPGPVMVVVYDLLGRQVRTLVDEVQPVGMHQVAWDGRDGNGQPVASGSYVYRLRVGEAVVSRQALRLR